MLIYLLPLASYELTAFASNPTQGSFMLSGIAAFNILAWLGTASIITGALRSATEAKLILYIGLVETTVNERCINIITLCGCGHSVVMVTHIHPMLLS